MVNEIIEEIDNSKIKLICFNTNDNQKLIIKNENFKAEDEVYSIEKGKEE